MRLYASFTRGAACVQHAASARSREGIPNLEPVQGTDWLSQLPEDVLWTILGFLDLPTLYTARLVCKSLRRPAALHFKALECTTAEELHTIDFRQFSGTSYLAVTVSHESHLQSLVHPRIAPVVTHVSLKGIHLRDSLSTEGLEAVLMHLPKLRSVSLQPVRGDSCLPLFPPTLETLEISEHRDFKQTRWAGVGDASPLTQCSRLKSLRIDLVARARTWMGSLSSLRKLRSLDLCSCSSALGLLSTFTALTSLSFVKNCYLKDASVFQDLGRLTGLSRLALTGVGMSSWLDMVEREDLACIAQLTNLTCLDLSGCVFSGVAAWSTELEALTRLVSVRFGRVGSVPRLSRLQLGALHSLTLRHDSCDRWAPDISDLRWAPRLTHLACSIEGNPPSLPGLSPALTAMSGLRSLELSLFHFREEAWPAAAPVFRLDAVLRACTMLTELDYCYGPLRPDSDLDACAALPGLRSLSFVGDKHTSALRLTPASLPALQAMSGLAALSLRCTGIRAADMTPDVIAAFDAERRQRGWPLLRMRVLTDWGGDCFERL